MLLGAIVLLVLASVVAAGIATLASQSALGTSSRLASERALFAVETGRLSVQASITGCPSGPIALDAGGYACFAAACDRPGREGLDVLQGWSNGTDPGAAQAVQQICFDADGGGYSREDFQCPACEVVDDGRTQGNTNLNYNNRSVAFGGGEDDGYDFRGNAQATFTDSDAVFLGPTTFQGNITFSASDSGPQDIGVVFTDDVTFAGNADVTFENTFVCFGGGVFAQGNVDVSVSGGEVRYTEGDPGFISHQGATVTEGGDCGGGGSNWDYAS